MNAATTETPAQSVSDAILATIQENEKPLSFKKIKAALPGRKPSDAILVEFVKDLVLAGKIFECSPERNQPRFWRHDEEQLARGLVLSAASAKPITAKAISGFVRKDLASKPAAAWCDELLTKMKSEGKLFVHPPLGAGKAENLFVRPMKIKDYLTLTKPVLTSLQKIFAGLESKGFKSEHIGSALVNLIRGEREATPKSTDVPGQPPSPAQESHVELENLILKGMRDLEPNAENGAPVLLWELRRRMPLEYRKHETFDKAVLRLAEKSLVMIQRHDEPDLLPKEDQDDMVIDEHCQPFFYISMSQ